MRFPSTLCIVIKVAKFRGCRTRKRAAFSDATGGKKDAKKSSSDPKKSKKTAKTSAKSNSGLDPQPSTSSANVDPREVKIDDDEDEHLDVSSDDVNDVSTHEESDHDDYNDEKKAMRMKFASALTSCNNSGHNSRSSRMKDASVQTYFDHVEHDAFKTENIKVKTYLKEKLECPVCNRISLPPIMQCRNGHIVCNSCRHKVR